MATTIYNPYKIQGIDLEHLKQSEGYELRHSIEGFALGCEAVQQNMASVYAAFASAISM